MAAALEVADIFRRHARRFDRRMPVISGARATYHGRHHGVPDGGALACRHGRGCIAAEARRSWRRMRR